MLAMPDGGSVHRPKSGASARVKIWLRRQRRGEVVLRVAVAEHPLALAMIA
jgi:hypothetical protein